MIEGNKIDLVKMDRNIAHEAAGLWGNIKERLG